MPRFSVKVIIPEMIESYHDVQSEMIAAFWAGAEAQDCGSLEDMDESNPIQIEVTLLPSSSEDY